MVVGDVIGAPAVRVLDNGKGEAVLAMGGTGAHGVVDVVLRGGIRAGVLVGTVFGVEAIGAACSSRYDEEQKASEGWMVERHPLCH